MNKQEAEKRVGECKTLLDLANVIRSLSNDRGEIEGITRNFSAEKTAQYCENLSYYPPHLLTRNFGIRDRALDILADLEGQKF